MRAYSCGWLIKQTKDGFWNKEKSLQDNEKANSLNC